MTSPRESRARALNALAALIHEIRTDWDPPGIVAALRATPDTIALAALGIAAIRYASDPHNLTPAHLADFGNRAWDSGWYPPCKTHPDSRARRENGECGSCYADRLAASEPLPLRRRGQPPAPDTRAAIVAAITTARPAKPRPRAPQPTIEAMAAARAELERRRVGATATPTGSTEEAVDG